MPIILTDADKRKLVGVDARLVTVVYRVAERTDIPFIVVEGVRTLARQRDLLKQRKTKTLKSNHLIGRAVDCAPRSVLGKVPWPYEGFRRSSTVLSRCRPSSALPWNSASIGAGMHHIGS